MRNLQASGWLCSCPRNSENLATAFSPPGSLLTKHRSRLPVLDVIKGVGFCSSMHRIQQCSSDMSKLQCGHNWVPIDGTTGTGKCKLLPTSHSMSCPMSSTAAKTGSASCPLQSRHRHTEARTGLSDGTLLQCTGSDTS